MGARLAAVVAITLLLACSSGESDSNAGGAATGGGGGGSSGGASDSGGRSSSGGGAGVTSSAGASGSAGQAGGAAGSGGPAGAGGGSGAAGAPGAAGCANVPSGFKLVTERSFDALDESGWAHNPTQNFAIRDSATYVPPGAAGPGLSPFSPSQVGEARYPAGMNAGSAPIHTYGAAPLQAAAVSRMHVCFAAQLSSNWVGHSSGVNKILFLGIGTNGNQIVISATGVGSGALKSQVRLQDLNQSPVSVNLPWLAGAQNVVQRGKWHRFEALFIANTPGQADGEAHLWLDGTKVTEDKTINYIAVGTSMQFTKLSWNPTYGGVGGDVSAEQYMWMDHLRATGAP